MPEQQNIEYKSSWGRLWKSTQASLNDCFRLEKTLSLLKGII
jgi:hypothetical protein